MEILKNCMFNAFILTGLITACLALIWYMLELLNRIFKFAKYINKYHEYKKIMELYDKNTVIVSKCGSVLQTSITDLDEQIEILEKAIRNRKKIKDKQICKKFSK